MGEVWIIECDHKPLIVHGIRTCFGADEEGTREAKKHLNKLPTDDGHYYDAVLYVPKEKPQHKAGA